MIFCLSRRNGVMYRRSRPAMDGTKGDPWFDPRTWVTALAGTITLLQYFTSILESWMLLILAAAGIFAMLKFRSAKLRTGMQFTHAGTQFTVIRGKEGLTSLRVTTRGDLDRALEMFGEDHDGWPRPSSRVVDNGTDDSFDEHLIPSQILMDRATFNKRYSGSPFYLKSPLSVQVIDSVEYCLAPTLSEVMEVHEGRCNDFPEQGPSHFEFELTIQNLMVYIAQSLLFGIDDESRKETFLEGEDFATATPEGRRFVSESGLNGTRRRFVVSPFPHGSLDLDNIILGSTYRQVWIFGSNGDVNEVKEMSPLGDLSRINAQYLDRIWKCYPDAAQLPLLTEMFYASGDETDGYRFESRPSIELRRGLVEEQIYPDTAIKWLATTLWRFEIICGGTMYQQICGHPFMSDAMVSPLSEDKLKTIGVEERKRETWIDDAMWVAFGTSVQKSAFIEFYVQSMTLIRMKSIPFDYESLDDSCMRFEMRPHRLHIAMSECMVLAGLRYAFRNDEPILFGEINGYENNKEKQIRGLEYRHLRQSSMDDAWEITPSFLKLWGLTHQQLTESGFPTDLLSMPIELIVDQVGSVD